jgi:predicted PurR-regulated permease PerM
LWYTSPMHEKTPGWYFLLMTLGIVSAMVFFILKPFIYPLILAAIFATVFYPFYLIVLNWMHHHQKMSALLTVFIVTVAIFTPVSIICIFLFKEIQYVYSTLQNSDHTLVTQALSVIQFQVQKILPISVDFTFTFDEYVRQAALWIFQHLLGFFGNFAKLAIGVFLFIVSFYFFLKDGHRLKEAFITLSPLPDEDDGVVLAKLTKAVESVVKGTLSVAGIQGCLTAIGFAIVGIDFVILGGCLAAIAALIPGLGTSVVLGPAILYLFFKGKLISAFGLSVWALCAVGLVDNILGPILIGRGIDSHPLLILFSVLGGIVFFGPIGFLLGPLSISLLSALLSEYSTLRSRISHKRH